MLKLKLISIHDASVVQDLIIQQIDSIGGQIQILETGIETPWGQVILGMDNTKQLVLFMINMTDEENLVSRLIGVNRWLMGNMPLLGRIYAKQGLDRLMSPRFVIVSPSFSPSIRDNLSCLIFPVEPYVYRGLEVDGQRTVLLEPVGLSATALKHEMKPETVPSALKAAQLSDAEVNFFRENHSPGPTA